MRGVAQTGSGKTTAFVLPVLEALARDASEPARRRRVRVRVRVLVLVPTRELAAQIGEAFIDLARDLDRTHSKS